MGREGTGTRLDRRQACTKERLVWSPGSPGSDDPPWSIVRVTRLTANFLDVNNMRSHDVDAAVTLVYDLLYINESWIISCAFFSLL
jgi:hypothetical protein